MAIPILGPVAPGLPIIELATTPAGQAIDDIAFSSIHRDWMRWTGTQWVFVKGLPALDLFDHFKTALADVGWLAAALSTGTVLAAGETPTVRHPHASRWSSSATANSGRNHAAAYSAAATARPFGVGSGFRCVFLTPPAAAATISTRIGFLTSIAAAAAQPNAAYLDIAGTTATATTALSSVTTASSGVTLTGNTWYTLHIIRSAADIRFIVISDAGVVALDFTSATNLPAAGGTLLQGAVAINSAAAVAQLISIDYLGVGSTL